MDYRIFTVRTWSFVHNYYTGDSDNELAQHFWLGKKNHKFLCAPDGVWTSGLRISSPTLYPLSHPVTQVNQGTSQHTQSRDTPAPRSTPVERLQPTPNGKTDFSWPRTLEFHKTTGTADWPNKYLHLHFMCLLALAGTSRPLPISQSRTPRNQLSVSPRPDPKNKSPKEPGRETDLLKWHPIQWLLNRQTVGGGLGITSAPTAKPEVKSILSPGSQVNSFAQILAYSVVIYTKGQDIAGIHLKDSTSFFSFLALFSSQSFFLSSWLDSVGVRKLIIILGNLDFFGVSSHMLYDYFPFSISRTSTSFQVFFSAISFLCLQ